MTIGIYQILCIPTEKRYIGSSKKLEFRIQEHFNLLSQGTHYNAHLQRAWNKYGAHNFRFSIVKRCSESDLGYWEQAFMDFHKSWHENYGFNIIPVASRSFCSDATKQKLKRLGKLRYCNIEELEKQRAHLDRLHNDPEWRQKIAEANKRRWAKNRDQMLESLHGQAAVAKRKATWAATSQEDKNAKGQKISKARKCRQAIIDQNPEQKQQQLNHMRQMTLLRQTKMQDPAYVEDIGRKRAASNLKMWANRSQEEKDAIVQKRLATMREKGITTRPKMKKIREDKS